VTDQFDRIAALVAPGVPVTWSAELPPGWRGFDGAGLAWGSTIWISPTLANPSFRFYLTLVHELAHVAVGPERGHSRAWLDRTIDGMHRLVDEGIARLPMPGLDTATQLAFIRQDLERTYA